MLKGKFVDNDSSNLTIIFQSAGRISNDLFDKILNNNAENSEVEKAHERYTWYQFSKNIYSDFYFVKDYYSNSYGWYMFDRGNSIIEEINNSLTQFIRRKNYRTVTAFGSSKGGTAALLYGIINPKINNVFSLVPQVHTIKYIDKKLFKYKELFIPSNNKKLEDYFDNIFFDEQIYLNPEFKNTKIYFYTGINDEQFDDLLKVHRLLDDKKCDNNIIINNSMKEHNNIVMDNVPFVRSALKLITNNACMEGPRLKRVNSNVLLLKDV